MQYKAMAQKNNYKWKSILLAILLLAIILPLAFLPKIESIVSAISGRHYPARYSFYTVFQNNQCYVSPSETVVQWKGTYQAPCKLNMGGVCVWPIPHEHLTYKITIPDGSIPVRSRRGNVYAAIDGNVQYDWQTYDASSWNAFENDLYGQNTFNDYQPIASNEYVVMVETRYRLFNNVDSTLGICVEKP